MAVSQIIGASIADGAIAAIDITDGTITTAKLAATTGSGNVVLSAAPTLTGNTSLVNLTVSGTQTNSTLTSGRVHYSTTGGLLTDSSNLQFDGTNLGIGVTPASWLSTWKALQVSNRTSLAEIAGITFLGNNFYQNTSSQNIYLQTGYATLYSQNSGQHNWQIAPSGTAGDIATLTQAMTLDASGYLGIGTTAPSSYGGLAVRKAVTVSSVPVSASFSDSSNSTFDIRHSANIVNLSAQGSGITIDTGNSTRMTITDAGLVGIGTTSPADALNIGNGKKFRATHSANVYQQIFSSASGNFLNAYGDNFELNADSGAIYLTVTAAQPMVFQTTNTERMRISAAGLVGIGTISPDAQLDVTRSGHGQIAVLQTSANRGFSFESQSNTALQIASIQASTNMDLWADTLSFSAGGTEKMRITSAGNVGIGTSSPADTNNFGRALDIQSSTGAAAYFRDSDDATKYGVAGFFGADSNAYYGSWGTSTGVLFYSSSTERMRIDSSGLTGIGTTTATRRLQVGSGAGDLKTAIGQSLICLAANSGNIGYVNEVGFGGNGSTNVQCAIGSIVTSATASGYADLYFATRSVTTDTAPTERMRLTYQGNFLLGTTTATANYNFVASQSLDTTVGIMVENLSNTVSASAAVRYKSSDASINAFTGIGSPTRAVYGGMGPNVTFFYTSSTAGMTLMVDQAGPITFCNGSPIAERMRLDSSGNVGIGTSSPQANLQVTSSSFPVLKVADNLGGGAVALGDSTISSKYVGIWRGAANSISGGGFLNVQGNGIAFMSSDNVFGSASERMRIDGSGDVLIGTTSSTTWNGGTTKRIFALANANSGDANAIITLKSNASTVDHGCIIEGYAIAVTAGSPALGSIGFVREGTSNTQLNSMTTFFTNRSGTVAERMRISSLGNLLIGTSTQLNATNARVVITFDNNNYYGLAMGGTAVGGAGMLNFYNSAGTEQGYISVNGTGTTTYSTSSDYRLKENIVPMTGALAKVAQLKPVTYTWKEDGSNGQGFIAHELAEVVPDCVTREKDAVDADGNPKYQGVDTSFLVATLVSAIQEQQALIESLTTRLTALEGK